MCVQCKLPWYPITWEQMKCESQSLREWKNEAIKMKLCVLMEKWILFHSSKMQTDNHKNCINMIWKFKMTEPGESKIKKSPILFLIVWKNPGMGTEWTGVPHCKSLHMHTQWFVHHNFYYNLTKTGSLTNWGRQIIAYAYAMIPSHCWGFVQP